jgi:NAD(P)-dependent dehydrogenase (short-subunit alcohol dehydrogenase family)
MDPFRDRVAVVTGGGSGIGAAMARAFAARGARLVLADLDADAMERVETELRAAGADAISVRTDVSKLPEVEKLADTILRRFGAVHIVCNNAGIATFGEIAKAPHEDWEFTMGVNFWGVVHGVEAFVPRLIAQGQGGHIVNTASMAGLVGMRWLGIYSASKFAVVGLTEALQRELEPHGIGVSVLCPMVVATNINENSIRNRPEHLRPKAPPPPSPPAGSLQGGTVTAEAVAARVVRAIDAGRLYVLTHPEQREMLRRRAARLDQAFEDAE